MIILDASAMIEFIARAGRVPTVSEAAAAVKTFAAPNILDFEVLNVLRRQQQAKLLTAERTQAALDLYQSLPLERYDNQMLMGRVWALRSNFTSYDASYIALAEILNVPLYTRDKKLFGKPGHKADVRLVELV